MFTKHTAADADKSWSSYPDEAPTELMVKPKDPHLTVPNTYMVEVRSDTPAPPEPAPAPPEPGIRMHWGWIAVPLILAGLLATQWG